MKEMVKLYATDFDEYLKFDVVITSLVIWSHNYKALRSLITVIIHYKVIIQLLYSLTFSKTPREFWLTHHVQHTWQW